jgi:hypothetical protein
MSSGTAALRLTRSMMAPSPLNRFRSSQVPFTRQDASAECRSFAMWTPVIQSRIAYAARAIAATAPCARCWRQSSQLIERLPTLR